MRISLTATALAFAFISTAISAESSLFSSVRINSVFAPSGDNILAQTPRQDARDDTPNEVADAAQLSGILRKAGFQVQQKADSQTLTIQKQLGSRSYPLRITVSEDRRRLEIAVLLDTVKNGEVLPTEKLIQLLAANRDQAPAYFAYDSKQRRTELRRWLKNRAVTGQLLDDEIERLVHIANEKEGLWRFEPAAKDTRPAGRSTAETGSSSLLGRWSAAMSNDQAFAIQFDTGGKFHLVHVRQGRQTRSSGQFTFDGQSLTLAARDGMRLTGTVRSRSETGFRLVLANSAATLIFKKAK